MSKRFLQVVAAAADKPAEILVHGPIGKSFWSPDGITSKEFTDALNTIPVGQKVIVGVNSPGGSCGEGFGFYNAIARRSEDVIVRVDGYALSIASFFPLAAGKIICPFAAEWMTHKAWNEVGGNSDDFKKNAAVLEKHDQVMVEAYMRKTGRSRAEIVAMLEEETWFTGSEAVAFGLADEETDSEVTLEPLDFAAAGYNPEKAIAAQVRATQKARNFAARLSPAASANTTKHTMTTTTPAAEPTASAPTTPAKPDAAAAPAASNVIDLGPVIDAINGLRDDLRPAGHPPGAEPVGVGASAQNLGDAFDKYSKMPSGADRRSFIVAAWNDIRTAGARKTTLPNAANTISSTLTTSLLSDTVVTVLQNRLAPLKMFFTDASIDPVKPLATIQVPKVTAGASAQTDPTDWESGNSTVTNTAITMHEYSVSFAVTSTELNSGTRMSWITAINAANMANKIWDVCVTPITVANFGAAAAVSAAAAFSTDDLKTLWAALKDGTMRYLCLDGGHYARLIPTNTFGYNLTQGVAQYGFDGIFYANRWSAAGANVVGFAASPEALVIAAGLPLEPPGSNSQFASLSSATIPGVEMPIQTASWVKPGTRVQWQAYDIMLGVAACDTSALKILASA